MSLQVCIFLCVLVICITALVVQIVEKYPQWCTYYEYKQKAGDYEAIKLEYEKKIEESDKVILSLDRFNDKETKAAFEYLQIIVYIRSIIKRNSSSVKAVNEIVKYLENENLL